MKIYFNGCSFTYGDELHNPQTDAWPAIVSSNLNSSFLNDAVSGGTNDRIVYKTLLNSQDYDFSIIAWTFYSRFTEYNPVDNYEINFNPQLNLDPEKHYSTDLKNNYSKYANYGKLYYCNWYNELYEFKKWLQQIILLQSFFELKNKKYIMLNAANNHLSSWLTPKEEFIDSNKNLIPFFDQLNDHQLLNEHEQINHLESLINKDNFIKWSTWAMTDLTQTYSCGPGGHFLESGHCEVATQVINFYNNL